MLCVRGVRLAEKVSDVGVDCVAEIAAQPHQAERGNVPAEKIEKHADPTAHVSDREDEAFMASTKLTTD